MTPNVRLDDALRTERDQARPNQECNVVLCRHGLARSQAETLLVLAQEPRPLSMTAFSERRGASRALTTVHIDALVGAGLAQRARVAGDRRLVLIEASEKGRAVAREIALLTQQAGAMTSETAAPTGFPAAVCAGADGQREAEITKVESADRVSMTPQNSPPSTGGGEGADSGEGPRPAPPICFICSATDTRRMRVVPSDRRDTREVCRAGPECIARWETLYGRPASGVPAGYIGIAEWARRKGMTRDRAFAHVVAGQIRGWHNRQTSRWYVPAVAEVNE